MMAKKAKRFMTGVLILFALLMATEFVDIVVIKTIVVDTVQKSTGRDFAIEGKLHINFFPLGFSAEKVWLANPAWAQTKRLASIDKVQMDISAIPALFQRKIEVKRFKLLNPTFNFELNRQGNKSWEFGPETAPQWSAEKKQSNDYIFSIPEILVKNAKLNYRDIHTETQFDIRELHVDDPVLGAQRSLELDGRYNQRPFHFKTTFSIGLGTGSHLFPGIDEFQMKPFVLTVGHSALKGDMALVAGKSKPTLKGHMKAKLIDAADFLQFSANGKSTSVTKGEPFKDLNYIDANIAVEIQHLKWSALQLRQLKAQLGVANGQLMIKPMTAQVAQGQLQGSVLLNAFPAIPLSTVFIQLNKAKAAALLKDAGVKLGLEGGNMQANVQLKSRGQQFSDMQRNLQGNVLLSVDQAKVPNRMLKYAGNLLLELANQVNPFVKKDKFTILECAVVHFPISQGVMLNKHAIGVRTSKVDIRGGGRINLVNGELQLDVKPKPRGNFNLSLDSLAGLLRIGGTVSNPKLKLNPQGVLKEGANVGAAILTGGASLFVEDIAKIVVEDEQHENPCEWVKQ